MAQYAMLIYANVDEAEAEVMHGAREAHDRNFADMVQSGALVTAFALHSAVDTATSVRATR
jgi:hypothetical protein